MYSPIKVAERLAAAERDLAFTPVYHTVDEVAQFEADLIARGRYRYNDLSQIEGIHAITADEQRWMRNEQVLCVCDASYFLTRYGFLNSGGTGDDNQSMIRRFAFRVPQRIYFDILGELQLRGHSLEILVLKARQLGVSVVTALLIAHRIFFSYGVNAVIGSADQKQTYLLSQMLFLCYDMLPFWLRPRHTARVEGERGRLMFGGLSSGVSFQHGSQKYGVGTGSTPTLYHLSEVALYGDDAVKLIDEGLWKAVHASLHVLGVLESTGRSNEGWFAKTWHYSKANYPNSRMYPMFLPWFCGVDIYPMPMDRVTHPIPPNWVPHRDTRRHVTKAALYVASTPLLSKHLIAEQVRRGQRLPDDRRPWSMPLEQQWYWEWNYEEAKYKGTESKFLQEMASDDEEALQRSTESVFGHETITMIDNARQTDFETYTISGQSIEDEHEIAPEYFDYTRERIRVAYPSPRGTISRWELIPLKHLTDLRHDHPEDVDRVLCIWEHPKPGYVYAMGGDTSEGKGADSTVASVWRLGYDNFPDVQVAEFASAYISHVEAFAFYLCLAAYYAVPMRDAYAEGRCRWREPYVSIEQLAAVGDTAQHQMGLLGYTNFHKMARYDGSLTRVRNQKRGPGTKIGWYTGAWSRPILLGQFVHYCRNGWAKVNSPWLVHEMRHFEQHETATGKPKMEHEEGQHDDRVFGAALSTFPPHDMDKMTQRSKKRTPQPTALPDLDLGPHRGNVISGVELAKPTVATLEDILYIERGLERYRDA